MSQDKLFVIAVGGTGMRCLESFVHLCSIGMFDNQEIEILTLDTDESNGNKKRVEDLIDHYIRIKSSPTEPGGRPGSNTFFSAKLRLTKYWTNYTSGRDNFQVLSKINESGDENLDLSSLFFDDNVQVFNLNHGYRAQTHLGSHLMYHGILESALNVKRNTAKPHEKEFMDFVERMFKEGKAARVFIFGSIFGGTGASSIPVIPIALKDAIKIRKDQPVEIEAKFAGSLLTEYFSFTSPNDAQKKDKKNAVIADSMFFTLNSQAALQFYQNDPTVKSTYKSLYHIGWPVDRLDFSKGKSESEAITGGDKQINPCHVTELLCAFAAYDFFNRNDDFSEKEAQYLFRSAKFEDNSFQFDFKDFCGEDKKLKNRLAGFYCIALFTLVFHRGLEFDKEGITGWLTRMERMKFNNYKNKILQNERTDINDFLKKFLFGFDKNGSLIEGWLYQLRKTVNGKFLLPNGSYGQDLSAIQKINPGVILSDEKSQWGMSKPKFGKPSPKRPEDSFDDFINEFIKSDNFPKESQYADSPKMELIAQLFNTVSVLQKIESN